MTISTPKVLVFQLHVGIGEVGRYRQVSYVDELAAILIGREWSQSLNTDPGSQRALVTSPDAMKLYIDPETVHEAFESAAHGMHVLSQRPGGAETRVTTKEDPLERAVGEWCIPGMDDAPPF